MEVPNQVANPMEVSYWVWYITYQKIEISISGILSHSFRRNSVFDDRVLFWLSGSISESRNQTTWN